MCVTLAYAHDNGGGPSRHQAVSFIMIGAYGEVLVVDWGIVKLASWYERNPKWVSVRASQCCPNIEKTVSGTPHTLLLNNFREMSTLSSKCDMFALG